MAAQIWRMLLGSVSRHRDIPSLDYYFLGALGDLVRVPGGTCSHRPIVRCGPTTFAANDRLVIIRYLTNKELIWIRAQNFEHIYYVIDDMLPLADECHELPAAYRSRLSRFAHE